MQQPKRNPQILRTIADHGPLDIAMIQRMVRPEMPKKNIRKSLAILREKNLIEQVVTGPQSVFYMISQALVSRRESAEILECHHDDLMQPLLRRAEWQHNQWCNYWINAMGNYFPEAEFIREWEISSHQPSLDVLLQKAEDMALRPDFLMFLPKTEATGHKTCIAFEIERTRKSDQRLIRKFKKYMNGTRLDGLIYLCDSGRLSEAIRLLYQAKLRPNSPHRGRFGDNFFLFSDTLDGGGPTLPRLLNAAGKPAHLKIWADYLTKTIWLKRRDEFFQ